MNVFYLDKYTVRVLSAICCCCLDLICKVEQVMLKGWGGNSVVGRLPGMQKVLAGSTTGSWGDGSEVKVFAT